MIKKFYGIPDMMQIKKKVLVPGIRVWCHNHNGSDWFKVFKTFKQAVSFCNKEHKKFVPEDYPLIAFNGYEINIFEGKR